MALHSSISPATGNLYELQLNGRISHPHWLVFLLAGLAQSQVSVVSGRAQQTGLDWTARLMVDFRGASARPDSLDYAVMAERKPASPVMTAPKLTSYNLARRADGSLQLHVQGPDQLGFLGRFLGRLALVMLFPVEIEINTVMGQIHDRVVLRGIGGTAPDESARAALETLLRGFTA
ncbi:MAG TPA: hypothetical protein VF681_15270 [Abditibacteriaceae bacterium]|jgi:hypothetical protein